MWVTIARDSESDYPLMVSDLLKFTKFGLKCQQWLLLYKCNCWFQSYGNTLAALFTHYPIVWTVKHSVFRTRVLAVLKGGLLKHVTLNPTIHSILWGNCAGLVQVTYFLPSYRWGDYVTIVFWITLRFYWRMRLNKCRPSGRLAQGHSDWFKPPPVTCWHPWSFIVA